MKRVKNVEAIIVTGDISNDGSQWSYDYVCKAFDALGVPVLCCPGNHDPVSTFPYGSTNRSIYVGGWKIILLNSVMKDEEYLNKNRASGYIYPEAMAWLREELNEQIPTCIALHHPTLDPGGWLNRKLLINREDFNSVIQNYEHVKLVMYGHIHYYTCEKIGHVVYTSASSVGFAFDKDLPKFQIADGKEGFSVIDISNDIKVTEIQIIQCLFS